MSLAMQVLELFTDGQALLQWKDIALQRHHYFVWPQLAHQRKKFKLQGVIYTFAWQSASIHDSLEVVQLELRKSSRIMVVLL